MAGNTDLIYLKRNSNGIKMIKVHKTAPQWLSTECFKNLVHMSKCGITISNKEKPRLPLHESISSSKTTDILKGRSKLIKYSSLNS